VFRDAGHVEDMWRVEAWILHAFPPQNVNGKLNFELRMPGFG
jgi:hypothetical protein